MHLLLIQYVSLQRFIRIELVKNRVNVGQEKTDCVFNTIMLVQFHENAR